MTTPRRITQKDVAKIALVDRATVSLALRNHPSIPVVTRNRIKSVAKKLGYAPDPMLSALATYRSRHRPKAYHGKLGWLAHTTPHYSWRKVSHFVAYFEAAKVRAKTYGFDIEVIDVGRLEDSWPRAGSVARARGVQGLLICPQPTPNTNLEQFPWDRFSAVTFGFSLSKPALHSVAAAQYRAAFLAMEQLFARNYRRIGFATTRDHDERTDHNFLAGYLAARQLRENLEAVPPFIGDAWDDPRLERWFWTHKPDAILTADVSFQQTSAGWKKAPPAEVGIVCPLIASPRSPMAGVWENSTRVGEAAVDFLVSLVNRGERGVPAQPQRLLIEGVWLEGGTVRAL